MSKKILSYILTVLTLFVFILLITNKLETIKELEFFQQTSKNWQSASKVIFSFVTANIINIIKLIYEQRKEKNNHTPHLRITIQHITNIRKDKNPDFYPEIVLGNGDNFVYIFAELENTGNGYIEQCVISNQNAQISPINHGGKSSIIFRVCRQEHTRFKKKYLLHILFKDDKNYYYSQKAKIIIHEEINEAVIILNQRQRRISAYEFNDKN